MFRTPKRQPWLVMGIAVLAIGAISIPKSDLHRRLIWNATASAPIGLYWLQIEPFNRGDLVLASAPDSVASLADERHYLPRGVPLVKRIAALAGDTVCAHDREIQINGQVVAKGLDRDAKGRPMPTWTGCRVLTNDVLLLMPEHPDSFDGRYFGPVSATQIIGPLIPIWTR